MVQDHLKSSRSIILLGKEFLPHHQGNPSGNPSQNPVVISSLDLLLRHTASLCPLGGGTSDGNYFEGGAEGREMGKGAG